MYIAKLKEKKKSSLWENSIEDKEVFAFTYFINK